MYNLIYIYDMHILTQKKVLHTDKCFTYISSSISSPLETTSMKPTDVNMITEGKQLLNIM